MSITTPLFLERLLPTETSKWLLAVAIPLAAAGFFLPDYIPQELMGMQSISALLVRLLLAVLALLLCMFGSLISVLVHHRKTAYELDEIKKHMSIEQMLSFQARLSEIQRSNR